MDPNNLYAGQSTVCSQSHGIKHPLHAFPGTVESLVTNLCPQCMTHMPHKHE